MKSSPASCLLIIKRFIDTAYSAVAALTRFEKTWAAAACPEPELRVVSVKIMIHRGYLLISIENPYTDNIVMKGGLPLSSLEGHGYGTRSITAIADAHGGQAIFNAENGVFTLKIMLPIKDLQQ